MNRTTIENQEVHVGLVKSQMGTLLDTDPERWESTRGYIPTCEYRNECGELASDGVDYVVVDENTIAWRFGGVQRDNGDWRLDTPEEFALWVIDDALDWLNIFTEELQYQEANDD